MATFRSLTSQEIALLEAAGSLAADWSRITVADGAFDPARVRRVEFAGDVRIGPNTGTCVDDGVARPAVLRDATITDCTLGGNVRITGVRGQLSRYDIGDGVVIEDCGTIATRPGSMFGNGVVVEVVNEGGGREVRLVNALSSQIAYLVAMHRHRPGMVRAIEGLIDHAVESVRADRGVIGAGASIRHAGLIDSVAIGDHAGINGATRLTNGTILSEEAAPTRVGANVVADDFLLAEGAHVDGGALLTRCFVGQGARMGRTFSAENSLFFANCEAFHSEAVALFAGPYTVTHHRSSLLIACVMSFYNAGSGTNQSNHMYKLGPVHQGIVERGAKTGSFSYMMWPCVVSPFTVVMGKNMTNFDSGEFPFSYITAEADGTYLTPAMNMSTVGTVRDGQKWPARDRRKATTRRDLIHFDIYSPYTVGRMMRGEVTLSRLSEETPREVETVRHKGLCIKRLLLRTGAKNYRNAIDLYLAEKILARHANGQDLAEDPGAIHDCHWADIGGMLVARERLQMLEDQIEQGRFATLASLADALAEAAAAYAKDEWAFVRRAYHARTGHHVDELGEEDLRTLEAESNKARNTFTKKVLLDAEKEFDIETRLGFGADGTPDDRDADFTAVRGVFDDNSFVKKTKAELR